MKLHRYAGMCLLLIFTTTLTRSPRRVQQTKHVSSPNSSQKQAIVFDLTNILFKEDQIGFAKKVGYATLASYTLTHWKSPGYRCLDMLAAMSLQNEHKPHITITLKERILPRCLVELQEGKKNCAQARIEIAQGIEALDAARFFSTPKEKLLMITIMNLVLDPEVIAAITEPNKQAVQLAQKLKHAGHRLYLFANLPDEFYASLRNEHPDIISLFDGIVISSQVKSVKPETAMFTELLTTHKLNPQECILIDDLPETISAAKKLGIDGVVGDKMSHVTNKLRSCGVKI